MINRDTASGTALLIAAAPAGKGCLIDATSVLPTLAAVPPGILTGTTTATIVELTDPADPQTVLTRIRAAAAAPGPLSLYITGQLHLDHKQHLIHLALARTTPTTLRYTALPWHWLASELKVRRRERENGEEVLIADMTVAYKLIKERFTSRVALDRARLQINVKYLNGPFTRMENRWAFHATDEQSCDVEFFLVYEFKSRAFAMLMGAMFDAVFRRFASAFERRADVVYGSV